MTLGYSGDYASGFPDEHAFEEWLLRIENIAEDERRLAAGEHVSGPAADLYRHRVNAAATTFAGRVLTLAAAKDTLANPLLQIYPGRAMTCVLDPAKALCQLFRNEKDTRRTPDQSDCRPNCQNIAYTDRDIEEKGEQARELREVMGEHLAPSPRHRRDRAELQRIEAIIAAHEDGRTS